MNLAQLKLYFRQKIKVTPGGPQGKTRGAGLLAVLDALAESVAEPGSLTPPTADQIFPLLEQGTGISITRSGSGKILIANTVSATLTPNKPAAPTLGQVDDTADTFSFLPTAAYPSFSQYKVNGLPGVTGAVALDATNSYVQGSRIYVKVVGAVAKGGLAVYVAGSGSVPDGQVLTNAEPFTGVAVVVPVGVQATKPRFGPINDDTNTVSLTSNYAYTEVEWGVEGQGPQALASNSICSPGNIAGRLFAYVIADPATNRLQSDTVFSGVFSLAATANNAPTATISVIGGTTTVTTGQSVVLSGTGQDSDAGDSITKLEYLDNGVKLPGGETSGASGSLQTPALTLGSHSFTVRATDSKGATGLSAALLVTAKSAAPANNKIQLFIVGDSITKGDQQGGPGSGNTYPEVAAAKLNAVSNNRFTLFQRGYPSMNARWFIRHELQNVLAEFDPASYGGGIMVVSFFGANDLIQYEPAGEQPTDHTPQGTYNTNVELQQAFRAAGAHTVIVPVMNRVDSYGQPPYSSSFNSDRLAVNSLYFSNRTTFADELADLRNQANIYPAVAPSNTTYFVDGVHPTIAGAALIGQEVASAVGRYYGYTIAGGSGGTVMPPIQNAVSPTYTKFINTTTSSATRLYNTRTTPEGWGSFAQVAQTALPYSGSAVRAHLQVPIKPGVNSSMLGFTTNANPASIADFLFAAYWAKDKYGVYENSAFAFPQTVLSAADIIDIVVTDKVRYYLSGSLFFTSLQAVPAGALYVFAALYTETNSTSEINNVQFEAANMGVPASDVSSVVDLVWSESPSQSANAVNQNGGLIKTSGTNGFDSGSTATYGVSASQAGGEKARLRLLSVVKPTDANQGQLVGFTAQPGTVDYNTIDRAIYWDSTSIKIFESGVQKFAMTFDTASSALDVVLTTTGTDYYRDGVKLGYSGPALSLASTILIRAALYGGNPASFIPAAKLQGLNLVSV